MADPIAIHISDIVMMPVSELKPHPKNPNSHSKEQIKRLAEILSYQGWRYPIKVSKLSGYITSGHGRLEAARFLGLDEVPVSFQDYADTDQEFADIVADNSIAFWSELDFSAINAEIENFSPDFDIDLLGIDGFKIDVAEKGLTDPDAVPENVETRVKPGDIWILGNHRLMCGDSTSIDAVDRLMAGERADMVFTSPPYGVGLDYNSYDDSFENTQSVVQSVLLVMSKVTDGYIALNWGDIVSGRKINNTEFPSQFSWLPVYNSTLNELNYYLWAQRIWKKPHARVSAPWSASSNRNVTDWEYIFTWSNGNQKSNNRQNDSHFGVIDSSESGQSDTLKDHPGAFPVYVAEKMVLIHTDAGFCVLDPFGGTGTTLIACEKTNRKCFTMELDPHYCDVIIRRWEEFTGQQAVLSDESQPIEEGVEHV